MFSMTVLKSVLHFLLGAPHKVMYTAATFMAVNAVLDFIRKYEPPKAKKQITKDLFKRILAYFAFVVIATRIDSLAVDALFGWKGSTQFLVFLYIAAREVRVILDYIRQQGIDIPVILDSRIGQMERSELQAQEVSAESYSPTTDSAQIDEQIQSLKEQIAHIESLQQSNEEQTINGGEHK